MEAPQPTEVLTNSRQALTSSASHDWGSPEVVRRFAAAVLRPAALGPTAIDLDATSSTYWNSQWAPEDRPCEYLDGSEGRDVFKIEDWENAIVRLDHASNNPYIGSLFDNPPGDPTGGNVQEIWYMIARMHAQRKIGSAFWVGFSLEQLRSLIPHATEHEAHLLHPLERRTCTVLPSSRIAYMAHPEAMIALYKSRLTKQRTESPEWRRLTKVIDALVHRSDDSPVKGPAPTHSSYLTILWHWDAKIRRQQKTQARAFLKGQTGIKSVLSRAAVIGDIDP